MLKSLKVHNFKTFLNTELAFGQRHLLIGKNNSGKTSLVKLLQFLALTATNELDQAAGSVPGGIEEIGNWNLKSDQIDISCACKLEFEGLPHNYTYELRLDRYSSAGPAFAKQSGLRVINERLSINSGGQDLVLLENDGREAVVVDEKEAIGRQQPPSRPRTLAPKNATMLSKVYELESNQRTVLFRNYLRNWRYFSLSPLAIREGTDQSSRGGGSQTGAPVFHWWTACDPLGFNVSNAIFQLKNSDEQRYRRIIQHVRMIEPALEAINYIVASPQQAVPFVQLSNQVRASWKGLSDGTLRALGMALIIETAAACSPPTNTVPCLSMIEEPENGIFPGLLRRLFDLFEEWAPTSQFIFTSHSPYFIDMFDGQREWVTILKKATDRSETSRPPKIDSENGADRLTLSMEYASELYQ